MTSHGIIRKVAPSRFTVFLQVVGAVVASWLAIMAVVLAVVKFIKAVR